MLGLQPFEPLGELPSALKVTIAVSTTQRYREFPAAAPSAPPRAVLDQRVPVVAAGGHGDTARRSPRKELLIIMI